jgi:ketosteroid isomerase-like protein
VSRENVASYRRAVEAWNRGDVDGLVGLMDEDVEIHSFLVAMEGEFRGHEGVRRWWQSFQELLPDWHAEVEAIESQGDAVIARLHVAGHGRGSGAPVEQVIWHVTHWRDGRVVRFSAQRSESEARESLRNHA